MREPDATIKADQDARIERQATCPHSGNQAVWQQRGETWIVCLDCGLPLAPWRVRHKED